MLHLSKSVKEMNQAYSHRTGILTGFPNFGSLELPRTLGPPNPQLTNVAEESLLYRDWETDRKSTRLNSSHRSLSRMPSSA